MQCHHQFFKGCVASPFANAIDGAFELASAAFHGLEKVGNSQAQVIVTMHRQHRFIDVGHVLIDAGNQSTKFRRGGVSDRIGDIDGAGTCCNRGLDHLVQELRIAATRVFTRELHVIHERAGIGHHLRHNRQHLFACLAQLVLEVDVAGGNKRVNPSPWRWSHGVCTGFDVGTRGPGQATNNGAVFATNLLSNALHRSEITRACKGEASLDHIHAETGQLLRDRQLLLEVEAGSRGLFTIPQGGVEDQYAAWILGHGNLERGVSRSDYELVQSKRVGVTKPAKANGNYQYIQPIDWEAAWTTGHSLLFSTPTFPMCGRQNKTLWKRTGFSRH